MTHRLPELMRSAQPISEGFMNMTAEGEPYLLFIPISNEGGGTGEYMRCLILAHSAAQAWPRARIEFVLHRSAPRVAPNPFTCHFYDSRESKGSGLIGRDRLISTILRDLRPDVAIFDSIGRGAQMSEARRLGISVIYVSLRKQARKRGFRLRHLRSISQHWAVQTYPGVSDLTPYRRWLASLFHIKLVELSALYHEPSADRISTLMNSFGLSPGEPYLLFVPGGGGYEVDGQPVADVFLEAAIRIVRAGGPRAIVVTGRREPPGIEKGPLVCTIDYLPNDDLMALMAEAEICVTGAGGGCVGQVLAHQRPLVASPLGGTDQRHRLELGQESGILLAADPNPESVYGAVMALLDSPDQRLKMIARQQQAGFRNGAALAMRSLGELLASRRAARTAL